MERKFIVLDASLVLKAILPNPDYATCQAALADLQDFTLAAPALWAYEITSALTKAAYFGQLTDEEARTALHLALSLGVEYIFPDETLCASAYDWTRRLQRAAAYDSFYLATAETLEANFWTADIRLAHSLESEGLDWVHWVGQKPSSIPPPILDY